MITLIELNPLNPFGYITPHCAEKIVSVRLRTGSALAEKVGRGGGWDHPLSAVHIVAARLSFEKAMGLQREGHPPP